MGQQGKRKEKSPDWQLKLTGNSQHISVEQPKGQPAPMGTNYKAPDWHTSPTGIEGKVNLGARHWSPTLVKKEDGQI